MLLRLFHKTEKEGTEPNPLDTPTKTRQETTGKKLKANFSDEYGCKFSQ